MVRNYENYPCTVAATTPQSAPPPAQPGPTTCSVTTQLSASKIRHAVQRCSSTQRRDTASPSCSSTACRTIARCFVLGEESFQRCHLEGCGGLPVRSFCPRSLQMRLSDHLNAVAPTSTCDAALALLAGAGLATRNFQDHLCIRMQ